VSASPAPRIGLLLLDVEEGGVERCLINLARGFVARGYQADLYTAAISPATRASLAEGVQVVELGASSSRERRRELASQLQRRRPIALLAAKDEDCKLALGARSDGVRVVLVASVDYSAQLAGRGASRWQRRRRYRALRTLFGAADQVFCVSRGVAEDLSRIIGQPLSRLHILPNPVVTPELQTLSRQPVSHPWLNPGQPPLVIGVGRFSRIKNFPLLVRAFARAHREQPMHLLLLGEGKQRGQLEALALQLGVADDLNLPGFVENPYPYMRGASALALSSSWEGFGNVLVEALACGTPVVATNCPSGPAEILQDGRYGPLVPMEDEAALAAGILRCLRAPLSASELAAAAAPYSLENSTSAYLTALGLPATRE
jgi:glycosyltransferase involved in cell wall biosynthesis